MYVWLIGDESSGRRTVAPRSRANCREGCLRLLCRSDRGLSALTLFGTIDQVRARGYLDLGGRQYNDHSRLANTAMYGMIDLSAIGDWKGSCSTSSTASRASISSVRSRLLGAACRLVQVARGRLRISRDSTVCGRC
jgi:hypothetical protein